MPRLIAALCVVAACSPENDDRKSSGPQNDNYGEALIGYKDGRGAKKAAAAGASDSQNGGASEGEFAEPTEPAFDAGVAPVDGGPSEDAAVDAGGPDDGSVDAAGDAGDAGDAGHDESPPAVPENPFFATADEPTSTFALDADTGAYTLARAALNAGKLPDPKSVRIEEFLNYFHFHYAQPEGDVPFALYTELSDCPWNPERKLLMIGVQGQEVKLVDQPPANLVFLLDVSGSMAEANKLPLLKKGFRMLAGQLRPQDRVSIVTYAGNEQVVLEGAHGDDREEILASLDRLEAGGSTNGEGGIQRAYQLAETHFVKGGNNRVLLATDGDFNVGLNSTEELVELISEKRDSGVFLSVYGFGDAWDGGNYEDETMEQLADNGNGIYFFIDSPQEARRAFLSTVSGSLLTVAKDVKVQVELSPSQVKAYRLIGYENRVLANEDFSNDSVDAGELGAGLSMTALYEIIPASSSEGVPHDELGTAPTLEPVTDTDAGLVSEAASFRLATSDLLQLRVRYKGRDETSSELIEQSYDTSIQRSKPSPKLSFAAAVSEFAMQLRGSQYTPSRPLEALKPLIEAAIPLDQEGAIAELRTLVEKASALRGGR